MTHLQNIVGGLDGKKRVIVTTPTSKWSMDGPLTPISVYLRVIFFGTPYTCVMYGIRQCHRIFFSCGEISAFFAKILFYISVLILNSSLHYQIFEFDTNIIQILVWIIGSTYRKGRNFEAFNLACQQAIFFCYTATHGTRSDCNVK